MQAFPMWRLAAAGGALLSLLSACDTVVAPAIQVFAIPDARRFSEYESPGQQRTMHAFLDQSTLTLVISDIQGPYTLKQPAICMLTSDDQSAKSPLHARLQDCPALDALVVPADRVPRTYAKNLTATIVVKDACLPNQSTCGLKTLKAGMLLVTIPDDWPLFGQDQGRHVWLYPMINSYHFKKALVFASSTYP